MNQNNAEKAHILTFTGKRFFILDPVVEDIDIRDIAHSLSMQCRWTGHCKFHYSVAQHSYYCSFLGPKKEAFARLMHDASEGYVADMSRPLKHYTDAGFAYRLVEKVVQTAINQRFGLPMTEPASVKIADNQMLFAERQQLMAGPPLDRRLSIHQDLGTANIKIKPWSTTHAERMFLKRFRELYKGK